jgi:hypothetical protein
MRTEKVACVVGQVTDEGRLSRKSVPDRSKQGSRWLVRPAIFRKSRVYEKAQHGDLSVPVDMRK